MKKIIKGIILMAGLAVAVPAAYAQVSVGVGVSLSANIAPPAIPVYEQPPCPSDGYLWTPGYWAYGDDGYYWVPGVWVRPPHLGLLWTPCYWGFDGGVYGFHAGYWGPHVGFYGGINYGFGYGGTGFYGGRWSGNRFAYNTAVTRVNTTIIHNTYINNTYVHNDNHVSFNGRGGVMARPGREEQMAANERHIPATSNQMSHQRAAGQDRNQFAKYNGGHPGTTAMNRVNGRKFNQQGRIASGVASGKLNARETGHLENRESNINKSVRNDRAANGGRLTGQERANVNKRQNNVSHSIYADKHNANNGVRANANHEAGQQRMARANSNRQVSQQRVARTNSNRQANAQRANQRTSMQQRPQSHAPAQHAQAPRQMSRPAPREERHK